jgi:hypothetical protein
VPLGGGLQSRGGLSPVLVGHRAYEPIEDRRLIAQHLVQRRAPEQVVRFSLLDEEIAEQRVAGEASPQDRVQADLPSGRRPRLKENSSRGLG